MVLFPCPCPQLSTCQSQKLGEQHEVIELSTQPAWCPCLLVWQGPFISKAKFFHIPAWLCTSLGNFKFENFTLLGKYAHFLYIRIENGTKPTAFFTKKHLKPVKHKVCKAAKLQAMTSPNVIIWDNSYCPLLSQRIPADTSFTAF